MDFGRDNLTRFNVIGAGAITFLDFLNFPSLILKFDRLFKNLPSETNLRANIQDQIDH